LEALEIPDPDRQDMSLAIDLLNIGMSAAKSQRQNMALGHLHEAREIFRKAKEVSWVANCDDQLAEVYLDLNMEYELGKFARRALDFAEISGNRRKQPILNYYLAIAMRLQGEFEMAEHLLDVSRDLALKYGYDEWKMLVEIDKELAGIYIIKGRVAAANEILRRIETVEEILNGEPESSVQSVDCLASPLE
jgi:tetratricopeptide (TPR) repeat protein